MRKSVLGLAILLAVTAPAFAAKNKAKHAKAKPAATQPANPNENTLRLLKDAIPAFLPAYTIPIYMKVKGDADKKSKSGKHKKK